MEPSSLLPGLSLNFLCLRGVRHHPNSHPKESIVNLPLVVKLKMG
jgi:hypothetical protein